MFTQRILWGKNGLMRNFKIFELSEKSRNTEMYIRSYSIKAHEYLGYASLIGMIGTGIQDNNYIPEVKEIKIYMRVSQVLLIFATFLQQR